MIQAWRALASYFQAPSAASDPMGQVMWFLRFAVALLMGAWRNVPDVTQLLVLLMAIDIALGLLSAIRSRSVNPRVAFDGMTRKAIALILVGTGAIINRYVGIFDGIDLARAASVFYIITEMTSIARHAVTMGVEVFPQFGSAITYFEAVAGKGTQRAREGDKSNGAASRSAADGTARSAMRRRRDAQGEQVARRARRERAEPSED